MRIPAMVLSAALLFSPAALAAEADGQIKAIDRDKLTITLDNGKTYKLPGEFDMDAIKEGMEVVIAFEKVSNENQITDMQIIE
ncbi:MAG: DUF1344 domain-containing protein [Rhizobiaceae bacterium]